jgi:rsbT antagonist protein RsbS
MNEHSVSSDSAIHMIKDRLIVPVGGSLDEDGLRNIGREILEHLAEKQIRGVVINVSAISILGSYGMSVLKETARSITMMGAIPVFVGFQPGVASALVDLEIDLSGILTALTTEGAMDIIAQQEMEQDQAE